MPAQSVIALKPIAVSRDKDTANSPATTVDAIKEL